MKIDSLDHVVLTVKDIDATCNFYAKVLGMEIVTFGENRKALSFGSQKINPQQLGRESTLKSGKANTPVRPMFALLLLSPFRTLSPT
jgi:catechol 2,3-dioxygenase-like lactoylglutathione lyase family enzyme